MISLIDLGPRCLKSCSNSFVQSSTTAIFNRDIKEISPFSSNRLIDPKLTPDSCDKRCIERFKLFRCVRRFFDINIPNEPGVCVSKLFMLIY